MGMISGAVAGLGAVTPAAGYVGPVSAIFIGVISGTLCYGALLFRMNKGWDESLDAWAIHGVGGLWGTIALGIFAVPAIGGIVGLISGEYGQLEIQIIGAVSAAIFAFAATYILAKIIDRVHGLRVSEEEEYVGLDISQHGEATINS
jgi:Amt family ammonium transporter